MRIAIALAVILASADAAAAETVDTAPLLVPLQRLVDAINHDDKAVPASVFTKDAVVIDDFAPYRWSGRSGGRTWYRGLVGQTAEAKAAFTAMAAKLTISAPQFARIEQDHAYMVIPAVFQFNDGGKRINQTGQWIITEAKEKGGWLIAGHAYAITSETEAARP